MLRTIFLTHRFVAGGFGLSLLLAPEAVNKGIDPGRDLSIEELLTLKSWACFMIIVALVVHQATNFPLEAQISVARSILVGFICLSILYINELYELVQSDKSPDYLAGVAATGSVFFVFAVAYSIALYKGSRKESLKSA